MTIDIDALLAPQPNGRTHTDAPVRRNETVDEFAVWVPEVAFALVTDPRTGDTHETYSLNVPVDLDEGEQAALRHAYSAMSSMGRPGWVPVLTKVKLDNGGWVRRQPFVTHPETGKMVKAPATTEPVRRYEWRLMPDPAAAVDNTIDDPWLALLKPSKAKVKDIRTTPGTFGIMLGDWQLGSGDNGRHEAVLARIQRIPAAVEARIKRMFRAGLPLNELLILGLGDIVEGCTNDWYSNQSFTTVFDRREQVKIARRLIVFVVTELAKVARKHGLRIRVAGVGGNHGENRKGGKVTTTYNDNDDAAVFEQAAEIVNALGYTEIEWAIPKERLSVVIDVQGQRLGITHGHLARGNGSASAKQKVWLAKQALAKQPIGDVDILTAGHYHHFIVEDFGATTFVQCAPLCDDSEFFSQAAGLVSRAGLTVFTVYPDGFGEAALLNLDEDKS